MAGRAASNDPHRRNLGRPAGLPQLWDAKALRARWNMGINHLPAFLHEYAGYRGASGKPVSIPVEVVLRLDPIAKRVNGSVPADAAQDAA